ncbi:MAG: DUF1634 domain-containing protein [Armatimonadota bacterium]|nr:DUF1634 domain-containing protein [Armatimonadota bacterium]MDR7562460.1 DUF1634 domain-containing protein [Armatimonadota bacterium]MDR7601173.1 DUF1634 domain-containing protein [Armatimonadota bacterium]
MRTRSALERIGFLLRAGVAVAGAVLVLGLVAFFLYGPPGDLPHPELLRHGAATTPLHLLRGLARGDPTAILQLGLLLLILTPILRVAMTVFVFAAEGDWIFVSIAAGVLVLLLLGLGGFGGGLLPISP